MAEKRRKAPARPARAARKLTPITADDLLKFQFLSAPQISPDGAQIVYVRKTIGEKNDYLTNLWMVAVGDARTGGGAPRPFTSGGKDGAPRWSPDGTRVAFISGRDTGAAQIYTIPASGGEAVALTKFPEGSLAGFKWSPDGRWLAVMFREQDPDWTEAAKKAREAKGLNAPPRVVDDWYYRLDGDGYFMGQRYRLYLVDTASGAHRLLYAEDTLGGFSFDWSPDSDELAVVTNRHKLALTQPWRGEVVRVNVKSGKVAPIPRLWVGMKDGVAWSPDGKWLAFCGHPGQDGGWDSANTELWICRPDGTGLKSLSKGNDYCLTAGSISDMAEGDWAPNMRWSKDSRTVLARIGWHGEGHLVAFPRAGGAPRFETSGAAEHAPANLSADGRALALLVGSWNRPPEVHVGHFTPKGFETRALTDANGAFLKTKALARPQAQWLRAADGQRVQCWVMRPPNAGPRKKTPGILEIHGGPHAQYGVSFFHEFQMLCAQGYTVFFSNPRGSKGYGLAHCDAIRGKWGQKDWLDIQAVIAAMQAHPGVDNRRLGVMGGSYGGYMTNWAVGHCRDFKAAITDRCVSNMVSMMGSSDIIEEQNKYWPGEFWNKPDQLWEMSPIASFGKVRTPMLIIHSEGDLRCNIEQSEQVYVALKLRGIPARFVRYPSNTSHGMSRIGPPDMRLHRLGQITEWWKKYLAR